MKRQLSAREAKVLELVRIHKTQSGVRKITGDNSKAINTLLNRLVKFGMLEKSGVRKKMEYRVLDVPYEVIEKRIPRVPADRPRNLPVNEVCLTELVGSFSLTEKQRSDLQAYRYTESRKQLARRLGISKTHLNFELMKIGGTK
ncbi:hypothetical protein ACP26L_25715 [Paenibacillus sp. S-38]|uniref:hypothetical protein n=1 Tax=Paenibacillus sp. S-38 TaxID=3416710 RepID=UPI003CE6CCFE